MSQRKDIIGTAELVRSTPRSGLIYTERCGWIDLGHANPYGGVELLWTQIQSRTVTSQCLSRHTEVRIDYQQSMRWKGLSSTAQRSYLAHKELTVQEQRSIALAIFMDVSIAFEGMQANWFYSLATDSGYSVEDLVSDLIGFYRVIYPAVDYVALCKPVSKDKALAIWDTYGPVGSWKNKTFEPMLFPDPTVPGSHPMSGPDPGKNRSGEQARRRPYTVSLPPELSLVVPAPIGVKFRRI